MRRPVNPGYLSKRLLPNGIPLAPDLGTHYGFEEFALRPTFRSPELANIAMSAIKKAPVPAAIRRARMGSRR